MAEGDIQLKLTIIQRIIIEGMKWNVVPDSKHPTVWATITDNDGADVDTDFALDAAETVVAAHNAVLDMILEEFK